MASSNIKLFDENKANIMPDVDYLASTGRLNGVQAGMASSVLNNKFAYQMSLVAYAIAQMMNANGLDANDTDTVTTFVSNLSNAVLQKVIDKASTAQAASGTDNLKWMSPALVKTAICNISNPFGWKLLQSYTAAGTFSWTAPDLFDGKPYVIGVCIIGGGGSGGLAIGRPDTDNMVGCVATGGGSGTIKNITMVVTPGTVYSGVVGAGGALKTATIVQDTSWAGNKLSGDNGSSSSFNGNTTSGGNGGISDISATSTQMQLRGSNGGQASDYNTENFIYPDTPKVGYPGRGKVHIATGAYPDILPESQCIPIDIFSNKFYLMCGANTRAYRYDNGSAGTNCQTPQTNDNGVSGSTGVANGDVTFGTYSATPSTAYGSGGSSICIGIHYNGSCTANSAKGGDGAVLIYVRGN